MSHDLNSADWSRIEASLRDWLDEINALPESEKHPRATPAIKRTLRKVERFNKTGEFTPQ